MDEERVVDGGPCDAACGAEGSGSGREGDIIEVAKAKADDAVAGGPSSKVGSCKGMVQRGWRSTEVRMRRRSSRSCLRVGRWPKGISHESGLRTLIMADMTCLGFIRALATALCAIEIERAWARVGTPPPME